MLAVRRWRRRVALRRSFRRMARTGPPDALPPLPGDIWTFSSLRAYGSRPRTEWMSRYRPATERASESRPRTTQMAETRPKTGRASKICLKASRSFIFRPEKHPQTSSTTRAKRRRRARQATGLRRQRLLTVRIARKSQARSCRRAPRLPRRRSAAQGALGRRASYPRSRCRAPGRTRRSRFPAPAPARR